MNLFFLEFRDPLFGVIIFFALIFVVAFFSYWFNKYKKREEFENLDSFIKGLNAPITKDELTKHIIDCTLTQKMWLLLAETYTKKGDFEKSIEIYTQLLSSNDKQNYHEVLFLLGKTFYMAGFLQRAKETFLEILKIHPRATQALNYLLLVYEKTKDYNSAMQILEPLEELEIDTKTLKAYLETLLSLNDTKMTSTQKSQKLLEIYKNTNHMSYLVFEYLFRVDAPLAWKNIDLSNLQAIVDILWRCKKEELDLSVVMQSAYLRELYSAKGYIDASIKSSIFELDILINLPPYSSATLGFEYVCSNCQSSSLFTFTRCPSCNAIDTQTIDLKLTKDYNKAFNEESNSFL